MRVWSPTSQCNLTADCNAYYVLDCLLAHKCTLKYFKLLLSNIWLLFVTTVSQYSFWQFTTLISSLKCSLVLQKDQIHTHHPKNLQYDFKNLDYYRKSKPSRDNRKSVKLLIFTLNVIIILHVARQQPGFHCSNDCSSFPNFPPLYLCHLYLFGSQVGSNGSL